MKKTLIIGGIAIILAIIALALGGYGLTRSGGPPGPPGPAGPAGPASPAGSSGTPGNTASNSGGLVCPGGQTCLENVRLKRLLEYIDISNNELIFKGPTKFNVTPMFTSGLNILGGSSLNIGNWRLYNYQEPNNDRLYFRRSNQPDNTYMMLPDSGWREI